MDARQPALDLQRGGRALLTLSARHVGELRDELGPLLGGARLKGLVALPPRDLLLILEDAPGARPRELLRLHLSADPDLPRFFLQTARQPRPQGPTGPFYRRLEEELDGALLASIEQLSGDRIARFAFRPGPGGERRSLVLELTGRHANLILLDGAERVLALLAPPPKKSAAPRLVEGAPWRPPPGRPRDEGDSLAELGPPPDDGPEPAHPAAPLSFLVERVLGAEVRGTSDARARRDLLKRVDRRLARARRLERGLVHKAEAAQGVERAREDGELLKANLAALHRGLTEIAVDDLYDSAGGRRTIALEAGLTPLENVERLFARYRKLRRSAATVQRELEQARERIAAFEALRERAAEPGNDPARVEHAAVEARLLAPPQQPDVRKRRAPAPRRPYRTFRGSAGSEIRVGRTARDNDELTLRHARGNDVWLHTANAPGSHVVLRLEKGAEPDPEEVLDAAHLAAHFSPLRDARKVAVHVARRKEVHKPKGAKPGLVTLSGGKVLSLRLQPERLERLLGGSR